MNNNHNAPEERDDTVAARHDVIAACAACHKIRDARGAWQTSGDAGALDGTQRISHGLCPNCVYALYPELAQRVYTELAGDNDFVIQSCG